MKCREFLGRLCEYLEDALGEMETGQIRAHVQSCADCRLLVESARNTLQLMGRAE